LVIRYRGGIAAVSADGEEYVLPLPVAGIMSDRSGEEVATAYTAIDQFAKQKLSSPLRAPFMTLSFMALLVIPRLKLSDLGLFDGAAFQFVNVGVS
jgi:adenine deaminase